MSVDRQALDGAENRDGGRDRAVGVEQGRADKAYHDDVHAPRSGRDPAYAEQREERDDAALPAIVGSQDEDAVFDRDDDDQGPKDHREDAEHHLGPQVAAMARRVRRLLERVERTGSDIPEHDAERADDGGFGDVIMLGVREGNAGGCGHGMPIVSALRRMAGRLKRSGQLGSGSALLKTSAIGRATSLGQAQQGPWSSSSD